MVRKESTIPYLCSIASKNYKAVLSFVNNYTEDLYLKDLKTQKACERCLEIIGDICKEILDRSSEENYCISPAEIELLKTAHKFRCKSAHGYDTLDPKKVYQVIQKDIPMVMSVLNSLKKDK